VIEKFTVSDNVAHSSPLFDDEQRSKDTANVALFAGPDNLIVSLIQFFSITIIFCDCRHGGTILAVGRSQA
jgi:hypothetical protein